MDKPDYSDLYKFVASIGTILLSLAIILPWLVLKEAFYADISATDISQLTPIAQKLIAERQNTALLLVSSVRWLSAFIAFVGIILLVIGVRFWSKKQSIIDQKDQLETKKLELEVQKMSLDQIKAKANDELNEQKAENDEVGKILAPRLALAKYLEYQNQIAEIALTGVSQANAGVKVSSYNVLKNVKMGDAEFDILIEPVSPSFTSTIVEIKYVPGKINDRWVQETIGKTLLGLDTYRYNRPKAVAVLFVLAPTVSLRDISPDYIKGLISDTFDERLSVSFIREPEIKNFTETDFLSQMPSIVQKEINTAKEAALESAKLENKSSIKPRKITILDTSVKYLKNFFELVIQFLIFVILAFRWVGEKLFEFILLAWKYLLAILVIILFYLYVIPAVGVFFSKISIRPTINAIGQNATDNSLAYAAVLGTLSFAGLIVLAIKNRKRTIKIDIVLESKHHHFSITPKEKNKIIDINGYDLKDFRDYGIVQVEFERNPSRRSRAFDEVTIILSTRQKKYSCKLIAPGMREKLWERCEARYEL